MDRGVGMGTVIATVDQEVESVRAGCRGKVEVVMGWQVLLGDG